MCVYVSVCVGVSMYTQKYTQNTEPTEHLAYNQIQKNALLCPDLCPDLSLNYPPAQVLLKCPQRPHN